MLAQLPELPQNTLNVLGQGAGIGGEAVKAIASNPSVLVLGVLLIAAAIAIFFFVKKIIVNSVLGFLAWIVLVALIGVKESLIIPTLAVSIIFGLAGVGAILLLLFFGVI